MTDEQNYFIQILSDHLNGRKSKACPGLDWDALLRYTDSHQVGGIVYRQCAAFLPEKAKAALSKRHAAETFYYANRVALFHKLCLALSEANIAFFCVKGLEVAQLYPIPSLRTMGDCDIVVHPEDQERAHPVLVSLGFMLKKKDTAEWCYLKNDIEIELHNHLLYDEVANTHDERAFFDAAWGHTRPTGEGMRHKLDWSFHFLFLLLHLKKHLIQSGVGFRQFMDLTVALRGCVLDWPWLERSLDALGLRSFACVCLALLRRWFDLEVSVTVPEITEEFYQEASEKIFAGGVFGYDEEENRSNAAMRSINNEKRNLSARLRYLCGVCFLPYDALRVVPEYAFLDGRPWLLPAAWVYRVLYKLNRKRGASGLQQIKSAFVSEDKLEARQRELAKWGLS